MTLPSSPCQHLTFALGNDTYALEITRVREVVDFTPITRIPGMPRFARGIINLRGNTVPVFDLNLKFGGDEMVPQTGTCIIIAQIPFDQEPCLIGILADAVHEVRFLEPEPTDSLEKVATTRISSFIKGIDRQVDGFTLVLGLETLFTPDEVSMASMATAS